MLKYKYTQFFPHSIQIVNIMTSRRHQKVILLHVEINKPTSNRKHGASFQNWRIYAKRLRLRNIFSTNVDLISFLNLILGESMFPKRLSIPCSVYVNAYRRTASTYICMYRCIFASHFLRLMRALFYIEPLSDRIVRRFGCHSCS